MPNPDNARETLLFSIRDAMIAAYPETDPFKLAPLILENVIRKDVRWALIVVANEKKNPPKTGG